MFAMWLDMEDIGVGEVRYLSARIILFERRSSMAIRSKIGFEHVDRLLDTTEGKTVITTDHSESIGDFNGIYRHKYYTLLSKLRTVPWLVLDGNRRDTFPEEPATSESVDEDIIRRNLQDLGYI